MKISLLKKMFIFSLIFFISSHLLAQPANNDCATATTILSDSTCKSGGSQLINQTLSSATYVASQINSTTSSCTFTASQDVWYKFDAKSKYPNISISNQGSSWGSLLKIQLFSGTCGALTEIACANNTPITITPLGTALNVGSTYYIRVHKNDAVAPTGTNWGFSICVTDQISRVSRMNEVFTRTYLSGAGALNYPWEIVYGQDDSLWITESRGYKVSKMSSINGGKRTVLDLSSTSTWFGAAGTGGADTLYAQNMNTWTANYGGWPQGGFAGMALHPRFGDGSGRDYVYVTYGWKYISGNNADGVFYRNKLVRFTYNSLTGKLGTPAVLDWNLPGSKDHNSQRLIIAPVTTGGTNYLFLSSGDMGAGQFENRYRSMNAQNINSYEGKILRYNLDSTGQPGTGYRKWIPSTNPYGAASAVWCLGIRNNQGFAYDTSTNILYGSSHGPYSDDEINIIEGFKNYGHPMVIGYAADGNYNGNAVNGTNTSISAGASFKDCDITGYTPPVAFTTPYCGKSTIDPVGNETTNKNTLNADSSNRGAYRDPVFSAYPSTPSLITSTWQNAPGNSTWESEGWSGMDIYSNQIIPGWKRSLISAGLKWGRVIKLNLGATGKTTMPSNIGGALGNTGDTITYFQSTNRYRDLAFAPNGKDIFLVMDNSSATSGPGSANPTAPACPGCVIKYSFLGYANSGGFSTIPETIPVTTGTLNACNNGTRITIDASNNALWVPITGPDGNIMAEINAMGQNLGLITSSFYKKAPAPNSIRVKSGVHYLDRNITITPAVTSFATPVKIRLYITKQEFDSLKNDPLGGIATINDLKVQKNNDACGATLNGNTTILTTTNTALADLQHGTNGYVLQTSVTSFSSFYFAGNLAVLPVELISFTGTLQSNLSALLKWKTENEISTKGFDLERSTDGNIFKAISFVTATGNSSATANYSFTDNDAIEQQTLIVYYRLKIINQNGTYKYSSVVSVTLPITKALISVVPNPVVNDLNASIVSPISTNALLRILDNTGRVVLQKMAFVKKGTNNFTQNIDQLSRGLYYLDISANGIIARTKFQKL